MRKFIFLLVFAAVVSFPFSAFAAGLIPQEYYAQAKVIMPCGAPVDSKFVKIVNDKMYVLISAFSGFQDVYTFNDLGAGASWDPVKGDVPGRKTSVAMLRQQASDGKQKTLIVVNKATGEVFVETEAETPELDAIIENGKVYLPLRATSELLGGRVNYDAAHDLAIVQE